MHRDGSGRVIQDIESERVVWQATGRTVSTYPTKTEWDAWREDFGELIEEFPDGTQIRKHATLKTTARGGTRKIVHNCVIWGNPSKQTGWTYYPSNHLQELLGRIRQVTEY